MRTFMCCWDICLHNILALEWTNTDRMQQTYQHECLRSSFRTEIVYSMFSCLSKWRIYSIWDRTFGTVCSTDYIHLCVCVIECMYNERTNTAVATACCKLSNRVSLGGLAIVVLTLPIRLGNMLCLHISFIWPDYLTARLLSVGNYWKHSLPLNHWN